MWNFAKFDVTSVLVGTRIVFSRSNEMFVSAVMDCAASKARRRNVIHANCGSSAVVPKCISYWANMRSRRVPGSFVHLLKANRTSFVGITGFTYPGNLLCIVLPKSIAFLRSWTCSVMTSIQGSSSLGSLRPHVVVAHTFRTRREVFLLLLITQNAKRCRYRHHIVHARLLIESPDAPLVSRAANGNSPKNQFVLHVSGCCLWIRWLRHLKTWRRVSSGEASIVTWL